jgi:hypothetical protein
VAIAGAGRFHRPREMAIRDPDFQARRMTKKSWGNSMSKTLYKKIEEKNLFPAVSLHEELKNTTKK